jgi:hypothetical protein
MDQFQQLQQQISELQRKVSMMESDRIKFDHGHTGFDFSKIKYKNISNKEIYVSHTLYGTDADTAANYGVIFIVPWPCVLKKFSEVHQTAGSDAGAVTVTLEKLAGTTAPDSGVVMLTSALSLKATANTVQEVAPTLTLANRTLAMGDRLCLKDAGTLTAVANVTIKIELLVL